MIRKILIVAALIAIPMTVSGKAEAADYCREYTKTVQIGGHAEQAYGTACYKPDGSWEIVTLEGSNYGRTQVKDVIYNDLQSNYSPNRHQKVVIVERQVRPHYPVTTYRRTSHSNAPSILSFSFGEHTTHYDKSHSKKVKYKKAKYKNNHQDKHHDNDRRGHR